MMAHRFALASWLTALALVSGCSSPEQDAERSARTALSWAATVRVASDALAKGAVPRVYAEQVLHQALETKRQLAQQPDWRSLPGNIAAQLEDAIRGLASALGQRPDSLPRP